MPIDMKNFVFGAELEAGQPYTWRVSGVWVQRSANTGSLYISMNATVADGPSTGQVARMPMQMLYHPGYPERTGGYIAETANALAKILGVPSTQLVLPQKAGERTETTDALLNALFVAQAKWVEAKAGKDGRIYDAHWETGPAQKAVREEELEVSGADYAQFFTDN